MKRVFAFRRAGTLAWALASGVSAAAMHAAAPAAWAQAKEASFVQKDVADQVAAAEKAVFRCDKANGRKAVASLKKTKEGLEAAAKTGFVQGAAADAKLVGEKLELLERRIEECSDRHKLAAPDGGTYGFDQKDDADAAARYLAEAQAAAKNCDRARYRAIARALLDRAVAKIEGGLAVPALQQLSRDLIGSEAEAFKHCPEPGKAEAPKAEPPKTEPAKTGTGTGATPGGVKPPEPPKAPPMTPQNASLWPATIFGGTALVGEFSLAVGFRSNSAKGEYSSNGLQAPGTGEGSETLANIAGGLTLWLPVYRFGYGPIWRRSLDVAQAGDDYPYYDDFPPYPVFADFLALGALSVGGRVTLDYLGDGNKRVIELVRHGPEGFVTLTERERSMVSLLLMIRLGLWINLWEFGWGGPTEAGAGEAYADSDMAQAPRRRRAANWWPVNVYLGTGPSFVRTKIAMTSNQAPGGGVFQSNSQTRTDTAWSFVLGAQTALCRRCMFGLPLMAGLEGQWTWMPSRSVSITSSTFGFTESGRVSGRSSARMMFNLSVPFAITR